MESNNVAVELKTYSGALSRGDLLVNSFSPREVLRRTVLRSGTVGAIAFVALFIPLIHLFMLPLGLFAFILTVIRTARTNALITQGSGPCPECKKTITINSRKFELPFKDSCEHCHREVILSLPEKA